MNIGEAIFAHLTSNPGVAALAGNRVYPKRLPQKPTYPAVVLHKVSGAREHTHDGPAGLTEPRWQIDSLSPSHAAAVAVAEAVRLAIDGFQGVMGGAGGVEVDSVFAEDERDDYDDELGVYVNGRDYLIMHHE